MPKVKFNQGDIVWVKWEDHYHDYTQGWQDIDFQDSSFFCETVGFVVKDSPTRLYLSGTISNNEGQDRKYSGGVSCKLKNSIVAHKILRKFK
jgi:hypothetical protein